MFIKNITVGYSRLVSEEGAFGNRKISCELTAELRNGDHWERQREELLEKCFNFVESKIANEAIIVISKEKAEKLRKAVEVIQAVNKTDLPF